MNPVNRLRRHAARPWQAWWLATLLLALQLLAQAHHVAHAPGLAQAAQVALADGHEAGGDDCRLLDALGLAAALHGGCATALGAVPGDGAATAQQTAALLLGTAAAYQARAPPLA